MNRIICGDSLVEIDKLPAQSVDLVFGSPPYENARDLVDDPFPVLVGQEWVDWMVKVYLASLRVCTGLVAYVVQGRTKNYRWSATPVLLAADLHRAGIHLRDFVIYHRIGIPGSGGPDWLRHDCEYIICATTGGRLPWSSNTAMGKPCKYVAGGPMSYRNKWGQRKNASRSYKKSPNSYQREDGTWVLKGYSCPERANPGNLVHLSVGGGLIGSKLAHKSEAPFPEALAKFFIKSFCPPGGTVLDPFSGSGTTCAVAKRYSRRYIGIDIRKSQCKLTRRRLQETKCLKRKP